MYMYLVFVDLDSEIVLLLHDKYVIVPAQPEDAVTMVTLISTVTRF
jgi:hypothetical protein